MFRLIATVSAVGLLAACGGGDGTSATLPKITTLSVFSDGAGVARYEDADVTLTAMAPNIQSVQPSGDDVAVDTSRLKFQGSYQYSDLYAGTLTVNGTPVNAEVYLDNGGEALVILAYDGQTGVLAAGGSKVSNIPSGEYTYLGTNGLGVRSTGVKYIGTFSMSVNFTNGTAAISGSTNNSLFGGSGIAVNNATGTFQGSNLNLKVEGYDPMTASIYGNFHGNGATSVSGIYHDNNSNPIFAGAIAGSR